MNIFHVVLRRVRQTHGIPHLLVELSVRTSFPLKATEVIANVEQRWLGWVVTGIERTL